MAGNKFLLLWLSIHGLCSGHIDRMIQIDQYRLDFVNLEDKLWEHWKDSSSQEEVQQEVDTLMKEIKTFAQKLDNLSNDLLRGLKLFGNINKFVDLQKEFKVIDTNYKKLKRCLHSDGLRCRLHNAVDGITNSETGVNATMFKIQDIVYKERDNVNLELREFTTLGRFWCKNVPQSRQLVYYNFYKVLSLYQLKGYILIQVANLWTFLVDNKKKSKSVEASIMARHHYKEWVRTACDQMANHNKDIMRCDPRDGFIKGKNYDEFTRLFQGHVENEVDMSSGSTCRESCDSYSLTKSYGCYDGQSDYCRKTPRCHGTITGCFFVESHATICVSKNPERRYEFVSYQSGKTLGAKTHCSDRRTVNSWRRWFVQCHYCMCLCNEEGPLSDRYISVRPASSNVRKNMVVTGLRFRKRNRILHLQIQQGKLLPYGQIDPATVQWVEVNDYRITDANVMDGTDFVTMTYSKRSMAMDDIQLDENHIMTGIQFVAGKDGIQLQVYAHEFDWLSGRIKIHLGRKIRKTIYRTKIAIDKPDVPTRTRTRSQIHNNPYTYVEFGHSDFGKDAAQTTVPFIDLQDVVADPPVPLSGAGVFYRGNPGYGGFIAPKIATFDYGRLVSKTMPDKPVISYVFEYQED